MGTTGTNNEAEAAGVLAGLEACLRKGFLYVHHFTDSKVVEGTATTAYAPHTYAMTGFSRSMHNVRRVFSSHNGVLHHQHVLRERNKAADAEANRAMNTLVPRAPHHVKTLISPSPTDMALWLPRTP